MTNFFIFALMVSNSLGQVYECKVVKPDCRPVISNNFVSSFYLCDGVLFQRYGRLVVGAKKSMMKVDKLGFKR